jgi:hypothetical protein
LQHADGSHELSACLRACPGGGIPLCYIFMDSYLVPTALQCISPTLKMGVTPICNFVFVLKRLPKATYVGKTTRDLSQSHTVERENRR